MDRVLPGPRGRFGTFAIAHIQKAHGLPRVCWPERTVFPPFLPSPSQPKGGQRALPVRKENYRESSKLPIKSVLTTAGCCREETRQSRKARSVCFRCLSTLYDTVIWDMTLCPCQNPKKFIAQRVNLNAHKFKTSLEC